jgi:hypothetical protein
MHHKTNLKIILLNIIDLFIKKSIVLESKRILEWADLSFIFREKLFTLHYDLTLTFFLITRNFHILPLDIRVR